ncbi:MAG: hypothetical protein AA908_09740 [Chlorobi bacterium NICIL-2]|nr:MAG: hypothetical protein AA908_09740 [Chlorobi bacterium NICIL-2]
MRRINKKRQEKPTFLFIVEGETEFWYLQMMKQNNEKLTINIKPELPHKKKLKEQFELVKELSSYYTKVFWIVDLDVIIQQQKINDFINFRNKIINKYKNVEVIINNPCLEFWFLLHFKHTTSMFEMCNDVEKQLKQYLNKYQKSKDYFTKDNNDIYKQLEPYLNNAIQNASKIGSFNPQNFKQSISEMYKIFQCLKQSITLLK